MPARQRSMSGASRQSLSPRAAPRPIPPANPPDPPLTLLHSISSRAAPMSSGDAVDRTDEVDLESGRASPVDNDESNRHPQLASPGRPGGNRGKGRGKRWLKSIGSGMWNDVSARLPYYWSDWTDAWNYRVIPATWFIFFANIFPGIAFSLDLIETTGQYGVQEVLLATFIPAALQAFFGVQPLTISGVTGPITVFNKVIFDIIENQPNPPVYLHFMGWVYLWGAILHIFAALFNAASLLRYVTRFSCDTFGFYVASVYVQYGIQVVERQFAQSERGPAILGVFLALAMLVLPHYFNAVARSGYANRATRRFCADYGMPIAVIAISGLAYWGYFNQAVLTPNMTLPVIEESFVPANNRSWLVKFWQLEGRWVGIALPFGIVLFILFYFDHNVSSLIAQGSEFPLRKPPGFHWDFFVLGIYIFAAGILGTPAPNGLIPQAPLHTASLVITGFEDDDSTAVGTPTKRGETTASDLPENAIHLAELDRPTSTRHDSTTRLRRRSSANAANEGLGLKRRISRSPEERARRKSEKEERRKLREVPVAVVEQRVSNLAQGSLCLILMTKPFQHVLGLIPKGVMAGLFWYMGTDALLTSGVTEKMLYLIRDPQAISPSEPLNRVRKSRILIFLAVELLGFGATFAVTQTIAAIGFPVIIMLLVPIRVWLVPRLGFTNEELAILDGPVASAFTLESVGGSI